MRKGGRQAARQGALALVLALLAGCGERAPEPGPLPGSWQVGRGPYDLALGDLDGDGAVDAAVGSLLDEGVTVLLAGPSGAPRRRLDRDLGGPVPAVALDESSSSIAAAVHAGTGGLAVLSLSPSGQLTLRHSVDLPSRPHDVAWVPAVAGEPGRWAVALAGGAILLAAEDGVETGPARTLPDACPGDAHGADGVLAVELDGDRHIDLALACYDSWSLRTLSGAAAADRPGAGSRLLAEVPREQVRRLAQLLAPDRGPGAPLGGLRKVAAGDLDHDGRTDLAAVGDWGLLVIVLDAGGEAPEVRILETGFDGSNTVALGDVTGDGVDDLVVTSGHERQLLVIDVPDPDNPAGYRMRRTGALPDTPESVALAELTGDGRLDAGVVAERAHALQWLEGLGDGLFRPLVPGPRDPGRSEAGEAP